MEKIAFALTALTLIACSGSTTEQVETEQPTGPTLCESYVEERVVLPGEPGCFRITAPAATFLAKWSESEAIQGDPCRAEEIAEYCVVTMASGSWSVYGDQDDVRQPTIEPSQCIGILGPC